MSCYYFQHTFNWFQRFETIAETDCIDNEAVDDIGGEGGKPEDPGDPSGVPDPQMMELDDLVPSSANESGSGKMQKGRGIY